MQPADGEAFLRTIKQATVSRGRASKDPSRWVKEARGLLETHWQIRVIGLSILADEKGFMAPNKGLALVYEPARGETVKALAQRIKQGPLSALQKQLSAMLHPLKGHGPQIPTLTRLRDWYKAHPLDGVWMPIRIDGTMVNGTMKMSHLKSIRAGDFGTQDIRSFGNLLGLDDGANETLLASMEDLCAEGAIKLVSVTTEFGIYLQAALAKHLEIQAGISQLREVAVGTSVALVLQGALEMDLSKQIWRAAAGGLYLTGQSHIMGGLDGQMVGLDETCTGPRSLETITGKHILLRKAADPRQTLENVVGTLLREGAIVPLAVGGHTLLLPAGHAVAGSLDPKIVTPGEEVPWNALTFTPEGKRAMIERLQTFLQRHGLLYLPDEGVIRQWLSGGKQETSSLGASVEWCLLPGKAHMFHERAHDSWLAKCLQEAEEAGLNRHVVPPEEWQGQGSLYLPFGTCIATETGRTWMHVIHYSIQEILLEDMHLAAVALVRSIIAELAEAGQVELVPATEGQFIVAARQEGILSEGLREIKDNFPTGTIERRRRQRALGGNGPGTGVVMNAAEVFPNPNRAANIKEGLRVLQSEQEQTATEWTRKIAERRPIFIAKGADASSIFITMTEEDKSRPTSLSFKEPFEMLCASLDDDMDADDETGQWRIETSNGTIYLKDAMEKEACAEWEAQRIDISRMSELQRLLSSKRSAGSRQTTTPELGVTSPESIAAQGNGGVSQAKRRPTADK